MPDAAFPLSPPFYEAASWAFAAELVRRAPTTLRLLITLPCSGQYDCLGVYAGTRELCALNRAGSLALFSSLSGKPLDYESIPCWAELFGSDSMAGLLERVTAQLDLPPASAPLPAGTPRSLTYRVIATLLKLGLFSREPWSCISGFFDSSDHCEVEKAFGLFPDAERRRQLSESDDVLQQPARRFWFLCRGAEPVLCLEDNGTAWVRGQPQALNLWAMYQERRSVPMVAAQLLSGSEHPLKQSL